MLIVLIVGCVLCVFFGMGIEAAFTGARTSDLEHDLFLSEIECERLKEGRP